MLICWRGELNPSEPLKTHNLLILNLAKDAKNAKRIPSGHAWGTRKFGQPLGRPVVRSHSYSETDRIPQEAPHGNNASLILHFFHQIVAISSSSQAEHLLLCSAPNLPSGPKFKSWINPRTGTFLGIQRCRFASVWLKPLKRLEDPYEDRKRNSPWLGGETP